MDWRDNLIQSITDYGKLVLFWATYGGNVPSITKVVDPIIIERNRLIVQGNERLTRIETLIAEKEMLAQYINDKEDQINELYDYIDKLTND